MGDLNPYAEIQKYTPRQTSIVDAIAEARRVVTAIARANPLRNAVVDDGLMRWRGKYGGDFLWVGEIEPNDPADDEPQRAVIIRRDDPVGADALRVYDPNPDVGGPLRQRVVMLDADGDRLLHEGDHGGLAWPYVAVPIMYGRAFRDSAAPRVNILDVGGTWTELTNATVPMIGHRWRFGCSTVAGGSPAVQFEIRLVAGGYVTGNPVFVTGDPESGTGAAALEVFLDFKDTTLWGRDAQWVNLKTEIRFTVIPPWVTAADVIWMYPSVNLLYSTAEELQEPAPGGGSG